jgi:hypothetical protein
MTPMLRVGIVAAMLLAVVTATSNNLPAHSAGAKKMADSEQTLEALRLLLDIDDTQLREGSSCFGRYGTLSPTLRDLLAMRLAVFDSGKNVIEGGCETAGATKSCKLNFYHAHGEDVSSSNFTFQVVNGKAVPNSLECVMSP